MDQRFIIIYLTILLIYSCNCSIPMPHVDAKSLEDAVRDAESAVTQQLNAVENARSQVPGSPAWFAAASGRIKVIAKNISVMALVAEEATLQLAHRSVTS
uniref:Uncharacterized protein n=1 Tax=Strigamia maritima TaxID=126957 RepID=T1JJI7_STRMM